MALAWEGGSPPTPPEAPPGRCTAASATTSSFHQSPQTLAIGAISSCVNREEASVRLRPPPTRQVVLNMLQKASCKKPPEAPAPPAPSPPLGFPWRRTVPAPHPRD